MTASTRVAATTGAPIYTHVGRNDGNKGMPRPLLTDEGVLQPSQTDISVPRPPLKDESVPQPLLTDEGNLTVADKRRV